MPPIIPTLLFIIGFKTIWYGTPKQRKRMEELHKETNKTRP